MAILKGINLLVAFLLELCALVGYAFWGFSTTDNTIIHLVLGIGIPVLVMVFWGIFMAPNSSKRLTGTPYRLAKLVIFGGAAIALAAASQIASAVIFAVVAIVNQVLLMAWKQE